jgi:hypothetical protein
MITGQRQIVRPCLMYLHAFGKQTYTFQHKTDYFVPYLDNNWQFLKFHAGMCLFGSQNLVPKICEYIESGHTFGCWAVKY